MENHVYVFPQGRSPKDFIEKAAVSEMQYRTFAIIRYMDLAFVGLFANRRAWQII